MILLEIILLLEYTLTKYIFGFKLERFTALLFSFSIIFLPKILLTSIIVISLYSL